MVDVVKSTHVNLDGTSSLDVLKSTIDLVDLELDQT